MKLKKRIKLTNDRVYLAVLFNADVEKRQYSIAFTHNKENEKPIYELRLSSPKIGRTVLIGTASEIKEYIDTYDKKTGNEGYTSFFKFYSNNLMELIVDTFEVALSSYNRMKEDNLDLITMIPFLEEMTNSSTNTRSIVNMILLIDKVHNTEEYKDILSIDGYEFVDKIIRNSDMKYVNEVLEEVPVYGSIDENGDIFTIEKETHQIKIIINEKTYDFIFTGLDLEE